MLTERFSAALAYACALHRTQTRKGVATPYVSHLLAVSALVLEHGGTEDQAIAALLHDAVEDQGGVVTAREIFGRFGPAVGQIVMTCTDAAPAEGVAKPAWRQRKLAFIERLAEIPAEAALVVTCDKLHNLTTLIRDVQRDGVGTLARFARPGSLAWYYSAIATGLLRFRDTAPVRELEELALKFAALTASTPLPSGDARA
jgi:(p)ppGpp synthase/HD superfamily hydrolase